jgi:hypothetical protein
VKDSVHASSTRGASVKADWRARLPQEKNEIFAAYVQEFETSYAMFSVSLNEAIELRQAGLLAKCSQVVWMAGSLCARMAKPLAATLRAVSEHAKHYGTIPSNSPLDSSNFQGAREQRSARMSGLLSRVLLTQRSQFLHKISTLHEMVENLDHQFRDTADELASGTSVNPWMAWKALDEAHYDLNTCLRESIVLLKCFIVAVPNDQLAGFQTSVQIQMRLFNQHGESRQFAVRHRRMTAIAGQ